MSIAVSALVRPSRRLRLALGAFALACTLAAAAATADRQASPVVRLLGASAAMLAAGGLVHTRARLAKAHQIDLSGLGQILLTVQQSVGSAPSMEVQLMPGSTLWPQLLLLRLGQGGRVAATLVVLPDSLAPSSFRALAVACRTLAGHESGFSEKNQNVLNLLQPANSITRRRAAPQSRGHWQ